MDASVAPMGDARVRLPDASRGDAAVAEDAASDAPVDTGTVDADASVAGYCCGGEAVVTDCSHDCVPIGVTFETMWPCPLMGDCLERLVFDGTHAAIMGAQANSMQVYFCNGEMLLDAAGRLLGRYFPATQMLLFRGESFCATDACRALWQVDGCASLFDGRWGGVSTGCIEEDDLEPMGCAYELSFEEQGWSPPPPSTPVCRTWGDDFVHDVPMLCTNNRGTCGSEPFRVHPTLGIEYGQRWYPSSVVPCDALVGSWVATDCACRAGELSAACPRTLRVEANRRAWFETVNASDEVLGTVACDGTNFVFLPDLEPRSPEWHARRGGGDIDVATDTLWVWSQGRMSTFVRAHPERTVEP